MNWKYWFCRCFTNITVQPDASHYLCTCLMFVKWCICEFRILEMPFLNAIASLFIKHSIPFHSILHTSSYASMVCDTHFMQLWNPLEIVVQCVYALCNAITRQECVSTKGTLFRGYLIASRAHLHNYTNSTTNRLLTQIRHKELIKYTKNALFRSIDLS